MFRRLNARGGFTLVELLVVISIIGVLMGLLLPAINSAREAGRKTQCLSNLKNLGYAALQHLDKNRKLPSGGWGPLWVGYPDGGNSLKQPGGWVYNLLPYLEETSLHDLGQGLSTSNTESQNDIVRQVSTAQSIMSCPTRRSAQGWPASGFAPYDPLLAAGTPITVSSNIARGDYAANAGVEYLKGTGANPTTTEQILGCWLDPASAAGTGTIKAPSYPTKYSDGIAGTGFNNLYSWSGVIYQRSTIGDGSIKDGLSRTYLFGEKFVDRKHAEDGLYFGDSGSMYSGMGADNFRTTYAVSTSFPNDTVGTNGVSTNDPGQPAALKDPTSGYAIGTILSDQVDTNNVYGCIFGSAHSGNVANFTFCDGSTKTISGGIDPLTHRYLGERNDGKILDDAVIGL